MAGVALPDPGPPAAGQRDRVFVILPDAAKKHGRTVAVVSHDRRIGEVADRVLWLQDGRLQETGEPGRGSPAASPSRELP